jgi:para-nitrobenzyl esterase
MGRRHTVIKSQETVRKIIILNIFNILSLFATAQVHCVEGRYDTPLFSESEIERMNGVIYGSALDFNGIMRDLPLDIYRPIPALDEIEKKPLVVFIHGGGLNSGVRDNPLPVFICKELAKNGFITASIDYRLGWLEFGECAGDTASLQRARYRADQDARAAVRFLKENADDYGIDTNYIFLAGASVGTTISLYTAYAEQADYYDYQTEGLGALDSSGNTFYNHTIDIAGVFGSGVGIERPGIIERADIPVLFFHGTCDFAVPYIQAPLFYCYEPVRYMTYYGSRYLADKKRLAGQTYWIYTNERGDHGAVDTTTMMEQVQPFLKQILCGIPESKEIYEYHRDGCVVSHIDTIEMEIAPNPVENTLNVEVRSGASGIANIRVFDAAGREVMYIKEDFLAPIMSWNITLPPATTSGGLYLLQILINESAGTTFFIRQ